MTVWKSRLFKNLRDAFDTRRKWQSYFLVEDVVSLRHRSCGNVWKELGAPKKERSAQPPEHWRAFSLARYPEDGTTMAGQATAGRSLPGGRYRRVQLL
jgi:hypothetical protein